MTRVDFYIVDQDSADARLVVACRIAEKAMLEDRRVYINAQSQAESERLDDLLWTFSQGSFVPHRIVREPAGAPGLETVLIGHGAALVPKATDVIINLAAEVPDALDRCARIAELVDGNAERRTLGRERFRYYRERGLEPETHHL